MGVSIAYTSDAEYIYLDRFYQGVTASYNTLGKVHTVQNADIPDSDILMVIAGPLEGDQCEFPLEGTDPSDAGTLSCTIGTEVIINIAEIHNITLEDVKGKVVTVTSPDGGGYDDTADAFGAIKINAENGTYNIDTDNIWPDSFIQFISKAK